MIVLIVVIVVVVIGLAVGLGYYFTRPSTGGTGGNTAEDAEKGFSIRYRNSTKVPITVWLDDMPFCSKQPDGSKCIQGDPTAAGWAQKRGNFYICDGNMRCRASTSQRKETLQPGETWIVKPPVDEKGEPYWCFQQGSVPRVCPGVGAWVTRSGADMPAIMEVTRLENNVNKGEIWANISAVDGANLRVTMTYSGKCPQDGEKGGKRVSLMPLGQKSQSNPNGCPVQIEAVPGVQTCPAVRAWPDLDAKCGPDSWNMAACPYPVEKDLSDLYKKEDCHKWWSTNDCALLWKNYIQNNPDGPSDQYVFAYDERRWKPGDTFDKNFNPPANKDVNPLMVCPLEKDSSLTYDILDIL